MPCQRGRPTCPPAALQGRSLQGALRRGQGRMLTNAKHPTTPQAGPLAALHEQAIAMQTAHVVVGSPWDPFVSALDLLL